MSLIVETAVVGSILSAIVSVASAFIAKQKTKMDDIQTDKLNIAESELHETILKLHNKVAPKSKELDAEVDKLLECIKAMEDIATTEPNDHIQSSQKSRG